jgi:uncharacterized membrane protein YeaQ/YmgE (transglycosylase-associated protein family)
MRSCDSAPRKACAGPATKRCRNGAIVFLNPSTGNLMGIIGTIVVGLIVGALARFVMPGEQKMGWIMTCLLGIAGSMLAGFIGQALNWYQAGQGAGWIASVLGAAVLLFVVQKLRSR